MQGRSDLFLKLEIMKKIVGMVLLLITMKISVMAMAVSLFVSGIFSQIINAWPNKDLLGYSYLEQLKDIMPNILLAVFMVIYLGVAVWILSLNTSSLCKFFKLSQCFSATLDALIVYSAPS